MLKTDSLVFVADENFDFGIVKTLREKGYSVFAIAESFPSIPDPQVLQIPLIETRFYSQKIRTLANWSIGFECHIVVFY